MEETTQREKQDSEYKSQNEDQGGIRRRLRDRDLLRKRKAEAEEKETNQVESQRKRSRAEDKSGSKKRGRPRKSEPTPQITAVQEEAAAAQDAPAVVVIPQPAEIVSDQITGSRTPLLPVESQPAAVLAVPAPAPLLESVQSPVFAPTLTSPPPVKPLLDTAPAPGPDAVKAPALSREPVPAAAPAPLAAPTRVETFYKEPQRKEALDQVLIEDLGPDEEEDISPSQDRKDDEGLSESLSINVPEQNKMYSFPTLSTATLPQEYLPGN
ncbi:nematocyst expressed protein 3-like isoform X2 [Mugil cephalus]|uniref:nematocyst expressed protein 3-like isoform X2 n=1 Tax=Mugil cephalus TaxID=48193 RepID=UPI001FB5AC63|nr:nematocyst expressed protein 3-like isoform X2 [Mugil cephalus]